MLAKLDFKCFSLALNSAQFLVDLVLSLFPTDIAALITINPSGS